jgi:multidrug efflux system membrane fusion protein
MLRVTTILKSLIRGLWPLLVLVVIILLIAVGYWYYEQRYPSTQDAVLYNPVVAIGSQITGRVVQVNVKPDQAVKRGQLLFMLDNRQAVINLHAAKVKLLVAKQQLQQLKANLLISRQSVTKAKANLTLAQKQAERYQQLYQKHAVAEDQYDKTQSALVNARAKYASALSQVHVIEAKIGAPGQNAAIAQAKLAIAQAQLALSYCRVHAPISGILTNLNLSVGQQVEANKILFGISPIGEWGIHANILEPFVGRIKVGQPVTFYTRVSPEQQYHGVVSGIGIGVNIPGWQSNQALPTISPTFHWVSVAKRMPIFIKVTSPNTYHQFRFGGSVSVTINTTK